MSQIRITIVEMHDPSARKDKRGLNERTLERGPRFEAKFDINIRLW